MALLDTIQQKSFLGPEFVTWLWFRSETDEEGVRTSDGDLCEIEFDKDLVLTSEAGQALNSTFRGEAPSMAPEAAAALAAGKKVKRAKIRCAMGDSEYVFTVDATNFDWRSLKIDAPPSLPFDEAVPLRLTALEAFHQVFDGLFGRFLDVRIDAEAWEAEEERMRQWIREKLGEEHVNEGEA